MEKHLTELARLDLTKYIHAANYVQKHRQWGKLTPIQRDAFSRQLNYYIDYLKSNSKIEGYDFKQISERTKLLNAYYDFCDENFKNVFTSQGKFRSTILEEFLVILFHDLIRYIKDEINDQHNNLQIGGIQAYTNLFFSAKNLQNFIIAPTIGINIKNQDFAIYRPITINIETADRVLANIPIVSIESKTYVDKTMLEGSIATAEKLKSGNPYTLFLIVTETWEVDLSVDPAYSRIDQIFVLRKCNNREMRQPIDPEVLMHLVDLVNLHLHRNWSDVGHKLRTNGMII